MKMKEVCAATGLTERAVRLYCSEGLLDPIRTELRDRVYLEFTDDHITTLKQIADLRGAGFSIEEIKTILDEPHLMGAVLKKYRARLEREQGEQARFLAAIKDAERGAPPYDAASLCTTLYPPEKPREYTNGAALREDEMSYREFVERGTPVGREIEYDSYDRLERRITWGRLAMIFLGIGFWIEAVLTLLINLSNEAVLGGLIVLGIEIAIWIFLMRGVVWLRVIMAIRYFFAAFVAGAFMAEQWPHLQTIHSYAEDGTISDFTRMQGSWLGVAIFGGLMLISAFCFYLIGFDRSVREYLYDRSTRY